MALVEVVEPEDSEAPRTSTKAETAYLEVRRRIANGVLLPGTPIDQEHLALELSISTTPLREALRRLESEQFVEISAHREARVRQLSSEDLYDLYEARMILEPFAARLAASHASEAEIRAFEQEVQAQPEGVTELAAHHADIHRLVYAACGNSTLVRLLDRLNDRAGRYRALFLPLESTHAQAVHQFQQEFASAFRKRDGEQMLVLLRDYLREAMYGFASLDGRWVPPKGFPRVVAR